MTFCRIRVPENLWAHLFFSILSTKPRSHQVFSFFGAFPAMSSVDNVTQAVQNLSVNDQGEQQQGEQKQARKQRTPPPPPVSTEPKVTGKCKWFDSKKGFGYITPLDGTADVFVHQSSIYAEGFRSLRDGELVEYNIEKDEQGRIKAANVTGEGLNFVKGAPRNRFRRHRRAPAGEGQENTNSDTNANANADAPQQAQDGQPRRRNNRSRRVRRGPRGPRNNADGAPAAAAPIGETASA